MSIEQEIESIIEETIANIDLDDRMTEVAERLLYSLPEQERDRCTLGMSFTDAVRKVLHDEETIKQLRVDLLIANEAAQEEAVVEAPDDGLVEYRVTYAETFRAANREQAADKMRARLLQARSFDLTIVNTGDGPGAGRTTSVLSVR